MLKAFQNRLYCLWPAFKSGGRCVAHFSTGSCSLATYLPDFKIGKISPYRCASLRHLSSIRSKDLNSPVLKSFQQIQKLLTANGWELLKYYENLQDSLLTKTYQTIPLKTNSNLVSQSLVCVPVNYFQPNTLQFGKEVTQNIFKMKCGSLLQ